ncbi:unnamed protein product [Prorocentrum cordatum]|uniref:Phospholipase B-like n=1 Tax=Prorocentrum cordatum TaxID=2364126 RepID=A0ABN9QJY4_9DINO|nr:unnamed protein product [Polarella glacialis]
MPLGGGLVRRAVVAAAVAAPAAAAQCEDARWRSLHDVLDRARRETAYREVVVEGFHELQQTHFAWYRDNYQDCVEGFVSLVLYLSLHSAGRQKVLLDLADHAARELNPLALRAGLASWPLFGLEAQLTTSWQGGQRAAPLPTEPWRSAPCAQTAPARISPLLAAMAAGGAGITSMTVARGLRQGSLLVDAGVFDGTDWSLAGVLAGATVVGFEPLLKNRRLFESRFPAALGEAAPQARAGGCRAHTLLDVAPGRGAPQVPWGEAAPKGPGGAAACGGALGHAYVLGAAVGERVRGLSMTTRYDYSPASATRAT